MYLKGTFVFWLSPMSTKKAMVNAIMENSGSSVGLKHVLTLKPQNLIG